MPANPVNDVRAAGTLRSKASAAAGPADEFQSRTLINPAGIISIIGNQGSDRFRVYGDGRAWVPVQAAAPASLVAGQFFIQTVAGVDRWAYVDSTLTIQYLSDPGGANTQVQFNDGGAFGGSANFTFNKTTSVATLIRASSSEQLTLSRTVTGVGTTVLGASGDRNTANTFDALRIFNGALTNSFQVQLFDTGVISFTGTGVASQFTLGFPVATVAGTAAAPGLAVASTDLDTGMYRVGANNIGFSTNGVLRLDIADTLITSAVNVQVGASTLYSSISGSVIEIGIQTGDTTTHLDLHAADGTYPDYATRLIRTSGANGQAFLQQRGSGALHIESQDLGVVDIRVNGSQ